MTTTTTEVTNPRTPDMSAEDVQRAVAAMPDEGRMNLFSNFCVHCGSCNPRCTCWKDE